MLLGKLSDVGVDLREEDGGTAEALLASGYLPVETVGEVPSVDYFETVFEKSEDETVLLMSYRVIPAPPRTFSKFKLKIAIASAGYLDEFTSMLAEVEVAPGYNGAAAFADAVTLDEDHPKFKDAVRMAKDNLGLTDEQVEAILAASVAG